MKAFDAQSSREPSVAIDLTPIAAAVVEEHGASACAVVAAAVLTEGGWRFGAGAHGKLWFGEEAPPASTTTLFDLASVTKPVTALAMARLERAGRLGRREALADLLPDLRATRSARAPLDLLAAHRAGLDGHRPLYAPLVEGLHVDPDGALRTAADARRADCQGDPPAEGFAPVYSDLGYLLIGAAIAARGGDELDRVFEREVTNPLGLAITSARRFREIDPSFDARVAPTEIVPWRGGVIRGAVHDENAWALVGSASAGHAGLFGDALSVARLGVAILDALEGRSPSWLEPGDLEPLVRVRPGGSLLAGFDRRSGDAPSSGARFGTRTFGHLGFTGTSLWMDPDAKLVGVLLTNRVHPTRENAAIRRARPAAYDAIAAAMTR
ncbi:MAG TPA: serine hydrolase domain-containing protein [Polyangiaceae bacterium]|nr:serine hydrolase domain-containing protein [Polyangiaceae bacterium]